MSTPPPAHAMQPANISGGKPAGQLRSTPIRSPAKCNLPVILFRLNSMKRLSNLADRRNISGRMSELSPGDAARWGSMSVHQMMCHLNDSYKLGLGEKSASPASGFLQRTLLKWLALEAPLQWAKGFRTRPEIDQGAGGSLPLDFLQDLVSLLPTLPRFSLPLPPPS